MKFVSRRVVILGLAGGSVAGVLASHQFYPTNNLFATVAEVNLTKLLAPAPTSDSAVTKTEIAELHDMEGKWSNADVDRAIADNEDSLFRFLEGMGLHINLAQMPSTSDFVRQVIKTAKPIVKAAKNHWARPRPALVDPTLKTLIPTPSSYAYPSGHATDGMLFGLCLAEMLPSAQEAFKKRAREFGQSRVIAGVHFPSDVEAGQKAAAIIMEAMKKKAAFREAFSAAATEIKSALNA